tara:strand:+ start:453 stop:734 length:282 start_codon:yes stop_codon:yes gene_type:complete
MKIRREKVNHISSLLIKDFDKREELDYKIPLNDIRLEIVKVFMEELKIDDDADTAARKVLASYSTKNLREGTDEWDVLYRKHYEEYLSKHGAE